MKRKGWWIAGIILLIAILGAGAFSVYQSLAAAASGNTPLETAVVEKGPLRVTIDGSGSVAAAEALSLGFTTGGKVAEVLVEVGDPVEAGQPLMRLETDDLEDAVAQAEISWIQARIQLTQTLAGPSAGDLDAAEASLRGARASYNAVVNGTTQEEIRQAEIELQQAKIALDSAQSSYDRSGGGWRAETEYSGVATSLWQAQATYDTAKAKYDAVVGGATSSERQAAWAKVQQAQASLDKLKNSPTPESIRLAEIAVEQTKLSLDQARHNLEQATLTAPMDGTVTAINVEEGETAGSAAVVLSTMAPLIVELTLDESDVVQVQVGQPVSITLDTFDDGEVPGKVIYVSPAGTISSGVVLYTVRVALGSTDLPIRIGMAADVEIIVADVSEALLIPLSAIQSQGERAFVLRQLKPGETFTPQGTGTSRGQGQGQRQGQSGAGNTAQSPRNRTAGGWNPGTSGFVPVPVKLGIQSDTSAQVLEGLAEGDVVVTTNLAEAATTQTGQNQPSQLRPGMIFGGRQP